MNVACMLSFFQLVSDQIRGKSNRVKLVEFLTYVVFSLFVHWLRCVSISFGIMNYTYSRSKFSIFALVNLLRNFLLKKNYLFFFSIAIDSIRK